MQVKMRWQRLGPGLFLGVMELEALSIPLLLWERPTKSLVKEIWFPKSWVWLQSRRGKISTWAAAGSLEIVS